MIRNSQREKHKLYLPWRVAQNWHGKIAIVDSRNNNVDVVSGRVCNLPQGKDGRGLYVAEMICAVMNATRDTST